MKINKNYIFSFISGILIFMSVASPAQTDIKKQTSSEDRCIIEVIIGVPKVSEKNLFVLTETVPKIKGLKYIDFCETDKILLLKYDQEIFPRPDDVIKAFQSQNILMPMLIKEGRFKDVEERCPNQLSK